MRNIKFEIYIYIYLRFLDASVMTIAHGADLESLGLLEIALAEELLHEAMSPLAVELKRFGRVAEVGAVQHILEDDHAVLVALELDDTGARHFLRLDHGLELG